MTESTRILPSRRTLIGGLAAAGTLAAVAITSNGGVSEATGRIGSLLGITPQSPLATAEMDAWQAAVGTRFEVAGSITLRLVGIEPLTSVGARPPGLRRRAFMAVFERPGSATLPGNLIYRLSSATQGTLDLLLVEGAGRAANRVFAVLN